MLLTNSAAPMLEYHVNPVNFQWYEKLQPVISARADITDPFKKFFALHVLVVPLVFQKEGIPLMPHVQTASPGDTAR